MRARLLLLAGLAAACGHTASLDRAKVTGSDVSDVAVGEVPVHGADTRVYLNSGDTLDGELLAVGAHALALHTKDGDVIVSEQTFEKVRVRAYSNDALTGALVAWSSVGFTSTISHGWFLIFSAPTWLATGIGTTVSAAEDSDQSAVVLTGQQPQLWQFARFPQGLPPSYPIKGNTAPAAPPPVWLPLPEATADAGSPTGDR